MSFDMSMQAPLHSPDVMSFWKYGSSPGSAAMRSVLLRRTRSNVLSLTVCACAEPNQATDSSAAAPARDRRPSGVVMVICLPEIGDADPQSIGSDLQSLFRTRSLRSGTFVPRWPLPCCLQRQTTLGNGHATITLEFIAGDAATGTDAGDCGNGRAAAEARRSARRQCAQYRNER